MNKVTLNGKKVKDFSKLSQFILSISGDNNEIELNDIIGDGCVYLFMSGNNNKFIWCKNNIVRNQISISFLGTSTMLPDGSAVIIGNNNFFNGNNINIIAPITTSIIIGNYNLFAGDIVFWGRNDHIMYDIPTLKRLNIDEDIIIGNENWICQKVSFLPGAIVQDNSVIGFGSIMNKKFNKNNILIAGVPGEIKKENINWSRSSSYEKIDFQNSMNIMD